MDISIVTDELSGDPETAIELGMEWGVSLFELRGVHDQRVPRVEGHVRRRLVRALKEFGAGVTAISPGLFKIPFPDVEPARSNLGGWTGVFQASWEESRACWPTIATSASAIVDFAAEVARIMSLPSAFGNGAGSARRRVSWVLSGGEAAARGPSAGEPRKATGRIPERFASAGRRVGAAFGINPIR